MSPLANLFANLLYRKSRERVREYAVRLIGWLFLNRLLSRVILWLKKIFLVSK